MTVAGAAPVLLQLVDIHRTFSTGPVALEVLQSVNLQVRRGDPAAIMGPSGSGKSTRTRGPPPS